MISNNIKIKLQSTKGFIDINKLNIGDKLLEYKTNNLLNIENIHQSLNPEKIFKILLTDGREFFISEKSFISFNSKLVDFMEINDIEDLPIIHQYQIDYSKLGIQKYSFPDPYICGALLINGDIDDYFINLPLDRNKSIDLLFNKYNLEYEKITKNNKVYFKKRNANNMISWEEFFNNGRLFPVTKNISDPIIPNQYLFGSINDRWQFIRGAFDTGYDNIMFPTNIALANKSENRLKEFQYILWSIGIISKISYDPNTHSNKGRVYRLDILNSYEEYPGLFYDIDNIRYILNSDNILKHHKYFELKIKSIEYVGLSNVTLIETNKHLSTVLTSNYLPYVLI